jgi:hypothetical protein
VLKLSAFIVGLLLLAQLSSVADTADAPPTTGFPDPASACSGAGGKYLGDKKCQMANGAVWPILSSDEKQRMTLSEVPVTPKSPHAWALAATAITFEFNGDRHDLLSGRVASPDAQESERKMLLQWWDVNSRVELFQALTWLQLQGHRTDFAELGSRVNALTEQQVATIEAAAQKDPQALNQLEITRKNYIRLGQKGILAWDVVRYITLCRWGYLTGYLSEKEAWARIMAAALLLQQTFSSWQDLQSNFLIGREFWSLEQTEKTGGHFREIYERFLQDPKSPWNANPWAMDLQVTTPLAIKANQSTNSLKD